MLRDHRGVSIKAEDRDMLRDTGIVLRLAIAGGVLSSISLGQAATGSPIFYDYDVNGGSALLSVEMPADPTFTGFAPLLSFDLTATFDDAFPDLGETVELTITLADFDGPADQPQAFFDTGVVTYLEVNNGNGTVFDGGGEEFDFAFYLFDNEANLQAFRLSDSVLFDACCSYAVTLAEDPSGPTIPEPGAALVFALGVGIVTARLRRSGAPRN
jgi:hypothetical protein